MMLPFDKAKIKMRSEKVKWKNTIIIRYREQIQAPRRHKNNSCSTWNETKWKPLQGGPLWNCRWVCRWGGCHCTRGRWMRNVHAGDRAGEAISHVCTIAWGLSVPTPISCVPLEWATQNLTPTPHWWISTSWRLYTFRQCLQMYAHSPFPCFSWNLPVW